MCRSVLYRHVCHPPLPPCTQHGAENLRPCLSTACSVLGSALTGAFNEVVINAGAATGTVALSSVTPVNMTVNLGGITTVLVDAPEGEWQLQ